MNQNGIKKLKVFFIIIIIKMSCSDYKNLKEAYLDNTNMIVERYTTTQPPTTIPVFNFSGFGGLGSLNLAGTNMFDFSSLRQGPFDSTKIDYSGVKFEAPPTTTPRPTTTPPPTTRPPVFRDGERVCVKNINKFNGFVTVSGNTYTIVFRYSYSTSSKKKEITGIVDTIKSRYNISPWLIDGRTYTGNSMMLITSAITYSIPKNSKFVSDLFICSP
jgi:hypothetical protein